MNKTCSGNGFCQANSSRVYCLCNSGYYGDECELENASTQLVKGVQKASVVVVILFMALTVLVLVLNDAMNLCMFKRLTAAKYVKKRKAKKSKKYHKRKELKQRKANKNILKPKMTELPGIVITSF